MPLAALNHSSEKVWPSVNSEVARRKKLKSNMVFYNQQFSKNMESGTHHPRKASNVF